MAHTFRYSVLQAVPDPRRGERVNIGIVVFLADRLDIRLSDIAKLRALTSEDWRPHLEYAAERLQKSFAVDDEPDTIMKRFSVLERVVTLSNLAWFTLGNVSEYERRISEILAALVIRPQKKKHISTTRLNTEIASEFRTRNALATSDEGIAHHKIVRQFEVSREENLIADFALKNGVYHIATTLDLRKAKPNLEEAALKAVVLDKAAAVFGNDAKCIAVFAADPADVRSSPHIKILKDYADETYNWQVVTDRQKFTRRMYGAMHPVTNFKLGDREQ